jgi:uracil phosphoribosyltransferase
MPDTVHVSRNPLVQHHLTRLRDRTTPPEVFRDLVRKLSQLVFCEAAQLLTLAPVVIQTPLTETTGARIADTIGLVPILRAGIGMADAILQLAPFAAVWHIGMFRDEATHQPVTYYGRLPKPPRMDLAIILDPMLATGGSASAAIDQVKQSGVGRVSFIGLIGAPEGARRMAQDHPDVTIHLAAMDSHLNEQKFIVPGLGDAGDRQFGTGD